MDWPSRKTKLGLLADMPWPKEASQYNMTFLKKGICFPRPLPPTSGLGDLVRGWKMFWSSSNGEDIGSQGCVQWPNLALNKHLFFHLCSQVDVSSSSFLQMMKPLWQLKRPWEGKAATYFFKSHKSYPISHSSHFSSGFLWLTSDRKMREQ